MFTYSDASPKRNHTAWGAEVKKRLIDRDLSQEYLVSYLKERGFSINKSALSSLLYGVNAGNKKDEIREISELLEIPYKEQEGSV